MKYKINYNSFGGSSSTSSSSSNNRYQDIESKINNLEYKNIEGIDRELNLNKKNFYTKTIKNMFIRDKDINRLIEYLNRNNIKITSIELKYIFDNNNSLRNAVNEWCDDNYEARIKYGDINTWDVSQVTDMSNLFRDKELFNDNISNWDTSNVTNMSSMFRSATSFNQNIYTRVLPDGKFAWDVSNVTDMSEMFAYARSFNGNISNWNTSNVTNINSMFSGTINFDGSIKNLYGIYARTNDFDGKNSEKDLSIPISSSSTSSSTNSISYNDLIFPEDMKASSKILHLNQIKQINNEKKISDYLKQKEISINNEKKISDFLNLIKDDDKSVSCKDDIISCQQNAKSEKETLAKEDYNDTSNFSNNSDKKVYNMYGIIKAINGNLKFQNINTKFVVNTEDQYLYTAWDVSNVTNMMLMFNRSKFYGNISNWNTSSVRNMMSMFSNNISFNGNISNWNTSNVTNMSYMFEKAILFNNGEEPIITREITKEDGTEYTAWDVSNVTMMKNMFYEAKSFNQPILNWDTSNVVNMDSMFNGSAFSDNRIALWPIKIDILNNLFLEYANMFNNSGITKYSFVYENNNKKIPYNRLIARYFNLPEEYMSINVTGVGTNMYHNINVNPIDKIIDVKQKLRNDIKNIVENIRDYILKNQSLEEKELKEQVKNYNKSFYDKYPNIINSLVEEETRDLNIDKLFTPYLQILTLEQKDLDNNRTLISYEIKDNDTLNLILMDHIVIYVKTLTGKTDTFKVNPEDRIGSVKQSIMNNNGIPIERQRLIFNSNELMDFRNLYYYNIINESTLYLVLKIQQQEQNL